MREYRIERHGERRQGPDIWTRSLSWLGTIGWLMLFVALLLAAKAKPQVETFFDRWYNLRLRTTWDTELAQIVFYLMILGVLLSVAGLFINSRRYRRRDDEVRVSLILMAVVSLGGIFFYIWNF